jgi:hypothetical protein
MVVPGSRGGIGGRRGERSLLLKLLTLTIVIGLRFSSFLNMQAQEYTNHAHFSRSFSFDLGRYLLLGTGAACQR